MEKKNKYELICVIYLVQEDHTALTSPRANSNFLASCWFSSSKESIYNDKEFQTGFIIINISVERKITSTNVFIF